MITFPNAKINLGLSILSKREDGFHDIESCFYPIDLKDVLEINKSSQFSFHSHGLDIPGDSQSNLCIKAYQLIHSDFNIPPVEINLLKKIPMGAGLGGGSADGAFTLKMLNDLFELNMSSQQLEEYALQLGSDCPFFIQNKPSIATGRGEILSELELDLSSYRIEIINPNIHISTKEAYAGVSPNTPSTSISKILSKPVSEWSNYLINDFENSVFPNHPKIENVKKEMYQRGAAYASMTGSGSTVFGIFK
ncbi:MAG: 4-(cytidine 5'-diphospho)-2-C-methyl-D-erythritol kinase [Ekhidna sp.]